MLIILSNLQKKKLQVKQAKAEKERLLEIDTKVADYKEKLNKETDLTYYKDIEYKKFEPEAIEGITTVYKNLLKEEKDPHDNYNKTRKPML